jgi:Flp pilus assembly protein TadD
LQHYLAAVKLNPGKASLHNDIGMTLLQLKRPAEAVKVLHNAAQLAPNDGQIHFNLALALIQSGNLPEARHQLEYAVQLAPNMTSARQLLSRLPVNPSAGNSR